MGPIFEEMSSRGRNKGNSIFLILQKTTLPKSTIPGWMTIEKNAVIGTDPPISVIIPVHNGERTIEKCLESILDQSISDFEVVVVDNASTDSTKKLIFSYASKDPRIRYVYERKKGRGNARARGIKCAKGGILAWTDADCVVPPNWLEQLTGPIIREEEMVVQGNEDSMGNGYWADQTQIAGQRHMDNLVAESSYIDHIDTKNLGIKRNLIIEIGGFDKRLKALEDFELKVRLKKTRKKIYYQRDLRVQHHHRERFNQLFRSRFEQGYWAAVIFFLHRDFFDSEKGEDNVIKSMYLMDTLTFPLHLMLFLFRHGPRKFLFEAMTGYIWRLGNLKGRFRWKSELEKEELEDH
jgi:glycosyltransferase involved in cell wall biosynthesis